MKHLLSLSLVFLFLNLSAQSKWSVGIVGGVDISNISSSESSLFERYTPVVVPRYGVNVEYNISHKLTIKSGLRINTQGQKYTNDSNGWGIDFPQLAANTNDSDFPGIVNLTYKEDFLEIPLHLKMYVSKGTWSWFVEGGVSPNFYLDRRSVTNVPVRVTSAVVLTEGLSFRKYDGTIDFGFGIEKSISGKICLSIQPMFRYYVRRKGFISPNEVKADYYNAGVELGCSYALN